MNHPFKPGDSVVCVNIGNAYSVRRGERAVVKSVSFRKKDGEPLVTIKGRWGDYTLMASRFQPADSAKFKEVAEHAPRGSVVQIRCDPWEGWQFRDNYYFGGWKPVDVWVVGPSTITTEEKLSDYVLALHYDSKTNILRRYETGTITRFRLRSPDGLFDWGPDTDEPWEYHHLSNKWFRRGIDPEPKIPATMQTLGLSFSAFPSCCGAQVLVGFNRDPKQYGISEVIECIQRAMEPFEGRTTGIVMAICSPQQNPMWQDVLEKVGFKLVSKHPNYNHGATHYNWLYHWVCRDHKKAVKEKQRSF